MKTWAVRSRDGIREVVWIETVRNGWWRGIRVPDGKPTRGPVHALLGRFKTEAEAKAATEGPRE